MLKPPICPLCHGSNTEIFFQSNLKWSVRSDWTPVPVAARVEQCLSCLHLFKQDELIHRWSDYQNYSVLENNPELDKLEFGTSMPSSRSTTIINFLRSKGVLTNTSFVLDYGCNRGAFLKNLNLPNSDGFDVSEHYRPIVEGLGSRYFTPQRPPASKHYDVLTLIHVAEHLSPLSDALRAGLDALKSDGTILMQVPNICTQPTDLYVIDHCSHFFADSFSNMMRSIGLAEVLAPTQILSGELTAIYKVGEQNGEIKLSDHYAVSLQQTKADLQRGERLIQELLTQNKSYVVYGAGLLGSLIGRVLGDRLDHFVDDNTLLQGKENLNRKISSLEGTAKTKTILVAVPPTAAKRVETRCREQGYQVVSPFCVN